MRNLHISRRGKQGGFAVLTLVLLATLLLVAITAGIAATRTSASTTTDGAKPLAATIIQQGNNLALGFQALEARGALYNTITFDSATSGTSLFYPGGGGASIQTPPSAAFATPAATTNIWYMKGGAGTTAGVGSAGAGWAIAGVGGSTNTTAEYAVFVLPGLSLSVCEAINGVLYNLPGVPTQDGNQTNLTTSAITGYTLPTLASSTVFNPTTLAGTGFTGGCIWGAGTGASAVYFYVVVAEPA